MEKLIGAHRVDNDDSLSVMTINSSNTSALAKGAHGPHSASFNGACGGQKACHSKKQAHAGFGIFGSHLAESLSLPLHQRALQLRDVLSDQRHVWIAPITA